MRVLHLNTWDTEGGAARGVYWLHKALQQIGVESQMLVAHKQSDDFTILGPERKIHQLLSEVRHVIDNLPVHIHHKHRSYSFSPAWLPNNVPHTVHQIDPDIVHLHWICGGFLTPETLPRFQQPIVWTLRDMWGFTGGCHYTFDCRKYETSCGACPYLDSSTELDISRQLWRRKFNAWNKLNIRLVAISQWLADCASQSSLFKEQPIQVIHNGVDESVFKPIPKLTARTILNLPFDKKIVLFGAINATSNPIKGFPHLKLALQKLAANGFGEHTDLVVFGSGQPQTDLGLGMKTWYLGRLYDDAALALVYSAADVMVVPSIQEAFGKTAIEALACGVPVVSFDSTGLKDIVEHQQNGYRATCFAAEDLANGIAWTLQDDDRWQRLSQRSRESVEQKFTLTMQANAYVKLYQTLLDAPISAIS